MHVTSEAQEAMTRPPKVIAVGLLDGDVDFVANTGESAAGDAPLVEVIRPFLSRGHVGLGCHRAVMSLAKPTPDKLPRLGCRDGRPTDPEAIEAAIADASSEQLARYQALCAGRRVA
jgi:hypothetical protein